MYLNQRIATVLVARRRLCCVIGILFGLVLAGGSALVGVKNDYRAFFAEGDGYIATTDWLQDRQGEGAEVAFLIYRPGNGDVFTTLSALNLSEVGQHLATHPRVVATESWLDAEKLVLVGDDTVDPVRAKRFAASVLHGANLFDERDQARLKTEILGMPHIAGRTVSFGGDSAVIRVFLDFNSADPDRQVKLTELQAVVADIQTTLRTTQGGDQLLLVGPSLFDHAAFEVMRADLRLLFPLAIVLISIILLVLYRSTRFVVLGLMLILLPVMATAGLIAGLGFQFTTLAVSGLLLVGTLAVADVLHVSNSYYLARADGEAEEIALVRAVSRNLLAVTATSLTTAIGQIAMLMSASPPIRVMGLVITCGVWIALLVTLLVLPNLLSHCRNGRPTVLLRLSNGLAGLSRWSMAHAGGVVLVGCVLIALAGASILQSRIGDSIGGWFAERTDFRQGMDILAHDYAGSGATLIALAAPKEDVLAARRFPAAHPAIALQRELRAELGEALPDDDWFTLVDMVNQQQTSLKAGQMVIYPEKQVGFGPFSTSVVARSGLMTRPSLGSRDHTIWHHEAAVPSSFRQVESAAIISNSFASHADGRGFRLGGLGLAFANLSVTNFWGIVGGSLIAIGLISLTMFGLLRDLRLGFVSIAPNLAPIILSLGLWCLLHDQINMAAATVFSVSMGLVVDDTIHVLVKFRALRNRGLDCEAAVAEAIRASGTGLLATTIVIASGFFLLGLSGFLLTAQKAGLVGLTVTLAFLFDMIMLPALLKLALGRVRNAGMAK